MSTGGLQQTIARGVAWVSLAAAVVAICDLISLAVLLRFWVDVEQFGVASVVITTFGALQLLVEAGLPAAIVQRGDDTDDARLSSAFWFGLGFGAAVYGVIWVVAPAIGRLYGHPMIADMFRAAGALLVIRPLYTTHQALLRRKLLFGPLSKLRVVANVLELGLKIGTAAAGAGPWCFVIGALAREGTYALGVPWIVRWRPRLTFAFHRIVDDFRFGVRATGAELTYQLYSNFDYQVVAYSFGAAALGYYRAAYELVLEPVRFLSGIVTTIAFPTFARLRHDRDALIEQLIAFTRQNMAVALMFVAAIVVEADDLLFEVYGQGYVAAAGAARVLALVGVLRAISHLGPPLLDGLGRSGLSLRYQLTAAVVLGSGFVIATHVGDSPFAIAVAWAIGYPIAFGLLGWLVLTQLQLAPGVYLRRIFGVVAVIAVAAAAGWGVRLAAVSWTPGPRLAVVFATIVALAATGLATREGFSPRAIVKKLRG